MKWLARVLKAVNAWAAMAGLLLLAATLVATITVTTFHTQWIVFLGGVLVAAIFAWLSHTANARWTIARRTAQQGVARSRLASESSLRAHAEKSLSRVATDVGLVNEAMPAMLVYLDNEDRVQYHNRAFARWTGRARDAIDGLRFEDVVGKVANLQLKEPFAESRTGHDVRYEASLTRPNRRSVPPEHSDPPALPGQRRRRGRLRHHGRNRAFQDRGRGCAGSGRNGSREGETEARIIAALENDEFSLQWQLIAPLARAEGSETFFHEVLLRMDEEEAMQIPPGTFLPVAEELGLLEEIDRWVVRNVLAFAATRRTPGRRPTS